MTKQKIIDSAILVLNEDYSASIEQIAEQAGLSRRTLHRYFEDRPSLISACMNDMMQTWQQAMLAALHDHKDPVEQLEHMLYAGIDCGVKYAFLHKLRLKPSATELRQAAENAVYTEARDQWLGMIPLLQKQGLLHPNISASWVRIYFANMVSTTIEAMQSGEIAPKDIKPLAWYAFRRGLGME